VAIAFNASKLLDAREFSSMRGFSAYYTKFEAEMQSLTKARIIGVDLDITKAVSTYGCDLIQRDSHELVKSWIWPLDLIFVDGDHGEAGVLLDAKFADFLPVGGIVAYQDCFDYDNPAIVHLVCPGVNAAVDKWFAVKQLEFEELASVETTRIFKRVRVKEHEQPAGLADRGGPNTHF
jgi:hypothetical protein